MDFKWLQIPLIPFAKVGNYLLPAGQPGRSRRWRIAVGRNRSRSSCISERRKGYGCRDFQSTPPVRPDTSTTFGMTRTSLLHFKEQEKRFLWDFYRADHLHLFLAFGLLFEQFALAGDIAAVAFCQDIFSERDDVFAGDDFTADSRLQGNFKVLAGNQFTQAMDEDAGLGEALSRMEMKERAST